MKIIFLLSLILLFVACGPGPTVTIEVCAISYLLPTAWCLVHTLKKFKKGGEPKEHCNIHHEPIIRVCDETGRRAVVNCPAHDVPKSEAPEFYCRRHARNALASPWLVMAWLDLQSKIQRWTNEELDAFAQGVGEAGVRFLRIFFPGWDDLHPVGSVFPYEREADGRWNLLRPNPVYDANLRRLAIVLGKYEVGLYIDMADQCCWDEYWDCWRRNINGVQGWLDESRCPFYISGQDRICSNHNCARWEENKCKNPEDSCPYEKMAFEYWKAAVDRVLLAIGGPEGHIIGLGNELGDENATLAWALAWAKPRVDYLISLGIPKPITHSAGGRVGHKINGAISDEDGNYPDNSFIAGIVHGIGLVDHVPPDKDEWHPGGFASLDEWLANFSKFHLLGYSDDGTDTTGRNGWNYIPPERAGTYDKAGDKDASIEEKIKLIKLFLQYFKEGQLRVIEFLPRCVSFDEGPDKLEQKGLDAFWRVGIEVFGIDPRRAF